MINDNELANKLNSYINNIGNHTIKEVESSKQTIKKTSKINKKKFFGVLQTYIIKSQTYLIKIINIFMFGKAVSIMLLLNLSIIQLIIVGYLIESIINKFFNSSLTNK